LTRSFHVCVHFWTPMYWAVTLDSAATDLSKTALKTPAGSPLKITSTLQTCLSLVSLTHTCAVQGEGGRAVVLCREQRGWRGRCKGVGFPLPWQQLQTHNPFELWVFVRSCRENSYEETTPRAFPHFTSKPPQAVPFIQQWSVNLQWKLLSLCFIYTWKINTPQ